MGCGENSVKNGIEGDCGVGRDGVLVKCSVKEASINTQDVLRQRKSPKLKLWL